MEELIGHVSPYEPSDLQEELLVDKMTKHLARVNQVQEYSVSEQSIYGRFRWFITDSHQVDERSSKYQNQYKIIFDGNIYNKSDIQIELIEQGFHFQTTSDAELLIALYDYKKEKALNDLRGVFSFVIWDQGNNKLFGARDHFGVKPFYYLECDDEVYFASEIKAFRENEKNLEVNKEALQYYFSFQYVPEPFTIYKDIYTLEPGHYFYKKLDQL